MKVFIAGPRSVTSLNKESTDILKNIIEQQLTVLVGDAVGVDKLVQKFLSSCNYKNVSVYASNGLARNNIGNWPVHRVEVRKNIKGFDFYAQKDIRMAQAADYGFMIWDGKSKGTLNNIINLTAQNKAVKIFLIQNKTSVTINNLVSAGNLAKFLGSETLSLYEKLRAKSGFEIEATEEFEQISISKYVI